MQHPPMSESVIFQLLISGVERAGNVSHDIGRTDQHQHQRQQKHSDRQVALQCREKQVEQDRQPGEH